MSYLMFIVLEAINGLLLYGTYRGVFGLIPGFLFVSVMLALSFHVMARQPRPDATSVRMACFSAALWDAFILSGKLFLEFRSWEITIAAGLFALLAGTIAAFAAWSVLERPLDYDVDEE